MVLEAYADSALVTEVEPLVLSDSMAPADNKCLHADGDD